MIHTEIISNSELVTSNYALEQIPKWKTTIKDGRRHKDLGKFSIAMFELDQIYVEPIFLVAKIKRSGTTIKSYLRTELTNGDFLELKSVEIFSLGRKDEFEAICPVHTFRINGMESGYNKRHIDFDSARDFYINEWIPLQNSQINETSE